MARLLHCVYLTTALSWCMCRLVHDRLSSRIVSTKSGRLRGMLVEFPEKLQPVEAYLGVEYASIHGDDLRFMPPSSPVEKWKGVKIANSFRPVCPQKSLNFPQLLEEMPLARVERLRRIAEYTKEQSEDCLFLNVYIPARERSGPAPVAVFIHGESYDYGTGNAYDGSVLAAYGDMTVVTLNYRLGPLGFMSTGDSRAPGNYALFDLVAALHWIKSNIADFGGDSAKVTVLGQGHGAALAHLLSLAPITKRMKLFNRLILQSGTALSSWSMAGKPLQSTHELMENLGCPVPAEDNVDGEGQIIDLFPLSRITCFRNLTTNKIMNANVSSTKYLATFGPVVDKVMVTDTPENMMQEGSSLFSDVQIIFGLAKYEGSTLLNQHQLETGLNSKQKRTLLRTYVRNTFKYHRQEILDTLSHHYSDWDKNEQDEKVAIKHKVIEFLGDGQFNVPAIVTGKYHLKFRDSFFYTFSHSSREKDFPNYKGGHHGEELPYIFGAPVGDAVSPFAGTYSSAEKALSKAAMRFWSNFIKSGNPNIPQSSEMPEELSSDHLRFMDVYWPRYEQASQKYLQLGLRPLVNHHYRGNRIALWTELIPKLHQKEDSEDDSHHLLKESEGLFSGMKDKDVRHVLPPPPTPPIHPPIRPNSTIFNEQRDSGILVLEKKPVKQEVVTKLIETIKVENFTRIITQVVPMQEEPDKLKMTLSMSVTLAVGCALLFLNMFILLGIHFQRSKLRTERKAIIKLRELGLLDDARSSARSTAGDGDGFSVRLPNGTLPRLTENHLYDKAFEKNERQNMNEQNGNYSDRGSMRSAKSHASENNSRGRQNYGKQNSLDKPVEHLIPGSPRIVSSRTSFPDPPSDYANNDSRLAQPNPTSTTEHQRANQKGSREQIIIHDYRKKNNSRMADHQTYAPQAQDAQFEMCSSYNSKAANQGSLHRLDSYRSQGRSDDEQDGHMTTPRRSGKNTPIPRQRTPESLTRTPSGRSRTSLEASINNGTPRKGTRRMLSEDGLSSDSGVQHMTYGMQGV